MKKKMMIVLPVIIILGAGFFGFLFFNGLSGIRVNPSYRDGQIKVACVGDSVTYGHSIRSWPKNNYPVLLAGLLGEEYNVKNFGVSGSTVQPDGDQPYVVTKAYTESLDYSADILVFMMGSNDSKPENWKGEEAFVKEYNALLDSYLTGDRIPEVYLCTPPVAFFPQGITEGLTNYDIQPEYVQRVSELVKEIAAERGFKLIDINLLTEGHRELFGKDNVHPNNVGAKAIADEVYENIR